MSSGVTRQGAVGVEITQTSVSSLCRQFRLYCIENMVSVAYFFAAFAFYMGLLSGQKLDTTQDPLNERGEVTGPSLFQYRTLNMNMNMNMNLYLFRDMDEHPTGEW